MSVTNKTWEDIFNIIIQHNGIIGIIIVVAIISFIIGGAVVWLYLSKIKYPLKDYALKQVEDSKKHIETELDKANKKIIQMGLRINQLQSENECLRKEHKDINDYRYVRNAVRNDDKDILLKDVFTDKQ